MLLARAQVDLVKRRQRMSALTVRRLQGIESSCAAAKLLCELLRHLAEPCTTELRNSITLCFATTRHHQLFALRLLSTGMHSPMHVR